MSVSNLPFVFSPDKTIHIFIEQFGRLRNSELVIYPLMVFSGESGLGKSYVALLSHYFYEILNNRERLNHFFNVPERDYNRLSPNYKNEGEALHFSKKELEEWLAEDAIRYVGYMIGNDSLSGKITVRLPWPEEDFSYRYKEELVGLVNEEEVSIVLSTRNFSLRSQTRTLSDESPFSLLLRAELQQLLWGEQALGVDKTFVLPPARGIFLTEEVRPRTGFYKEFFEKIDALKEASAKPEVLSSSIISLFEEILDGEIKFEEGAYYYYTQGQKLPLSSAASAIREIAALEQFVKKRNLSALSLLFEEPEAHLHPLKQRKMADVVGSLLNAGVRLQITTHSDYFLRRLNELLRMHQLKTLLSEQDFQQLQEETRVSEATMIDESKIAAYVLLKSEDGSSKIVRQALEEGIPFTSFGEALEENINMYDLIENSLP